MKPQTLTIAALAFLCFSQPALAESPAMNDEYTVYVKIILPIKAVQRTSGTHANPPSIESWIGKEFDSREKRGMRAVTRWLRLPGGNESVELWNATIDGKHWGCPVTGSLGPSAEEDRVELELFGWTPVGAELHGKLIATEVGTRGIVVVDCGSGPSGDAFVAYVVAPSPPKLEQSLRLVP